MPKYITDTGRQTPLVALQPINFDEVKNGDVVVAVKLPPGAIVLGGALHVVTAFDGGAATLALADDSAFAALAATSLAAVARTALAGGMTGKNYPAGTSLKATIVAGSPTKGKAFVEVQYVVPGRATETQT